MVHAIVHDTIAPQSIPIKNPTGTMMRSREGGLPCLRWRESHRGEPDGKHHQTYKNTTIAATMITSRRAAILVAAVTV